MIDRIKIVTLEFYNSQFLSPSQIPKTYISKIQNYFKFVTSTSIKNKYIHFTGYLKFHSWFIQETLNETIYSEYLIVLGKTVTLKFLISQILSPSQNSEGVYLKIKNWCRICDRDHYKKYKTIYTGYFKFHSSVIKKTLYYKVYRELCSVCVIIVTLKCEIL